MKEGEYLQLNPKKTGRDDSQLTLQSNYEPHLVGCSKRTPSR